MAFLLPIPNGNPWPKSWAVQLPFLGNNISSPRPSCFQKTLKLAYNRDIRCFRKYYNKDVKQVICSGITLPPILASRCKNVKILELYEHSQVRSKLPNLKTVKLGQLSQKKQSMTKIKRLVRYNKNLQEIWVDREETMKVISASMKCPRLLSSFSLGLCNSPKDKMRERMQFLTRLPKLKQIALCTTEPQNPQARQIDVEAQAFMSLLGSLFKKNQLKALKLDVVDPQIVEKGNMLNNFLLRKLNEKSIETFDLRLALTYLPVLNSMMQEFLGKLDYFALSVDGVPFQKASFWAEEILKRQKDSQRRFMVDFRGLSELDMNPFLRHLTPSLRVLDLSFTNNACTSICNWADITSRLQSLQSLSINFAHCPSVLASTLHQLSVSIGGLPSLKYTAINLENLDLTSETYEAIDNFYIAIQHIPEHSFGLQIPYSKDIQLDTLCNSLKRLESLNALKLMIYLRSADSVHCIGDLIAGLKGLERLDLHIRFDTHESMAFDLPLEDLPNLHHLRVELLFRPQGEFFDRLNTSIARLVALEHLELTILYYSKVRYSLFRSLLARLNMLKALKELEMSVNLEDENANESLTEKNVKLRRELEELIHRHPSLTKVMFHHFVSYICCTR